MKIDRLYLFFSIDKQEYWFIGNVCEILTYNWMDNTILSSVMLLHFKEKCFKIYADSLIYYLFTTVIDNA